MNIWTQEQVKAFNSTLEYHAFDLAADGAADPGLIESMFAELDTEFSEGRLEPLPKTVFSFSDTVNAFRYMAQARHIGKIVISQAEDVRRERVAAEGVCRADGTYVITGGLGALGLLFAEWLTDNGAGHIALFGRSAPKPHAEKKINELREKGANVRVFSADVSDPKSLTKVFTDIRGGMPPIRGVLHAAGVLLDAMMISSDWENFENAIKPKVYGGWMLHELTKQDELDMFVLFSSVAALFGNRGQSNYAAGNAFLDGLAHYRRELGLPATTLNWGPWGEVGMATDAKKAALIAKQGFYNIATDDGLQAFGQAIAEELAQLAVVELNTKTFSSNLSDEARAGFFEDLASRLAPVAGGDAAAASKKDFWTELALAEGEEGQLAVITEEVKEAVAAVLNFKSTDDIDGDRQFRELGFDSLTNAEFINRLDKSMQVGLSQSLYMEFPTVNLMSSALLKMPAVTDKLATIEVSEQDKAAASAAPAPSPEAAASQAEKSVQVPSAKGNGRGNGEGDGSTSNGKSDPAQKQENLSYKSPVKGFAGSEGGKALEKKTDDIMASHLSQARKADDGEKRSWWQRFLDALTDIEN